MPLLLVMFGGALGSGLRFLVGRLALAWFGPKLPWGTLFANITGGLAMGLLAGLLLRHSSAHNESVRLFTGVGILGGYTTFSSFTLETVTMLQRGELATGLLYILASLTGAILMLLAGLALARMVPA